MEGGVLVLTKILANVVIFAILAPYDNEQADLVHRINSVPNLAKIPLFKYLKK